MKKQASTQEGPGRLSEAEKKKLASVMIKNQQKMCLSMIKQCEGVSDALLAMKVVLIVFSREEIRKIDQLAKKIPGFVEKIRGVRHDIGNMNYNALIYHEHQKLIGSFGEAVNELSDFVESQRKKVPEPGLGLINWILRPYACIACHAD